MAGLHNTVATALATTVAGITGMSGCSPVPIDSLNATPWGVVGPPKGQLLQPGSWERFLLTFPLRVYLARVSSSDRDQVAINDFLDLFLVGFRSGITLGGVVTEAIIKSWDTDRFYTIGGEDFQAIDFVIGVELERAASYSA